MDIYFLPSLHYFWKDMGGMNKAISLLISRCLKLAQFPVDSAIWLTDDLLTKRKFVLYKWQIYFCETTTNIQIFYAIQNKFAYNVHIIDFVINTNKFDITRKDKMRNIIIYYAAQLLIPVVMKLISKSRPWNINFETIYATHYRTDFGRLIGLELKLHLLHSRKKLDWMSQGWREQILLLFLIWLTWLWLTSS